MLLELLFKNILRSPPGVDYPDEAPSSEPLSSRVTHSITVTDGSPSAMFSETATLVTSEADKSASSILGDQTFIQWNQTPPTVLTEAGLRYTPP